MAKESSKANMAVVEDDTKNTSTEPSNTNIKEDSTLNKDLKAQTTEEDCTDELEKNKAVVEKMFDAAPAVRKLSATCKCMKRKGKFYCYKLRQGAWMQASGTPYPTKDICEANNCFE